MSEKEMDNKIKEFIMDFISETEELEPEINEIVNDNFWELL